MRLAAHTPLSLSRSRQPGAHQPLNLYTPRPHRRLSPRAVAQAPTQWHPSTVSSRRGCSCNGCARRRRHHPLRRRCTPWPT
eukprot:5269458-Prymnesium_polylepis.1